MALLDLLKRAQEGINLSLQESDEDKKRREERMRQEERRKQEIGRTLDNLTTVGRGVLEPIARTLVNFGSNVVGGALGERRRAKEGTREQDALKDLPAPVAGMIRGIIEGEGLTPKSTLFEEAGPAVGLRKDSLPALALGLGAEIALPGPGEGKAAQKLAKEAKAFGSFEEFAKNQGLQLFRGGKKDAPYMSTSLDIAKDYVKERGGKIKELFLRPDAKVVNYTDVPNAKYAGLNDYNVGDAAPNRDILSFMNKDVEKDYTKATQWAKEKGYDAIVFPTEGEVRVISNKSIIEKSKLKQIWEQSQKTNTIGGDVGLYQKVTEKPRSPREGAAYRFFTDNLPVAESRYVQRVNQEFGTTTGNIVSADEAKYIVPGFDAIQSANYHEPASGFAKFWGRKLLQNPNTKDKAGLIMSGGSGAGKTSSLRSSGIPFDDFALVHDTNLNSYDSAVGRIEDVLQSGRPVNVVHVYREPVEAFKNGVIPRVQSQGRIVPVEAHVDTHIGSRDVLERLMEKYKGNKNVSFNIIDNSRGPGKSAVIDIDELPKMNYTKDTLRDKVYAELNIARQEGRITDAQLETFIVDPATAASRSANKGGQDSIDALKGVKSVDDAGTTGNYIDYGPTSVPIRVEDVRTGVQRAGEDSMQGIARTLAESPEAKRMRFKKGEEFGSGVRVPVTVRKQFPLPDDIRTSYQARAVMDPHDATSSEVFIELDLAEAGQRMFIENARSLQADVIGVKSTFPEWVPPHLRSRKLFDAISQQWPAMPPSRNVRQRELYDVVQNEINRRLGIDVTINTEGVPDEAGQILTKTVGRYVGTDMTFEGQTSVFRKRAQGDEAEQFNRLFDKHILRKNADYQKQKELLFNKNVNTPEVVPGTPVANRLTVMQELVAAPEIKDVGNIRKQGANIDRVFRKVFGQHYELARSAFLDPLDDAKDLRVRFIQEQQKDLRKEIVDRFGIKKKSKLSKAVQQYGEKNMDFEALVRDHGAEKANQIVEAAQWFRGRYDDFIDRINIVRAQIYPGQPDKLIPKRKDYFRHFRELSGVEGIKNLFETPAGIDPSLEGLSAYTKPNSKWQSIFQQRRGPETVEDAVGGFLDYIEAAGHSLYIDPQIKKMNQLREALINVTANPGVPETYKKLNNFIRFLEFYTTQSLAGKTGLVDRAIMENIPLGRQGLNIIHYVNSNIKASIIMGKFSSVVAQVFNMPQGIAEAGEIASTKASLDMVSHLLGKNEVIDSSKFLRERYDRKLTRSFDERMIDKPARFMEWMLEVGDEVATKFIWFAQYRSALAKKIGDPIRHADVVTRNLVGGRGIGEVPLIQREKSFRVIAPFTLEMGNFWWVVKDQMDAKQYTKLVKLLAYNWMFNTASEALLGRRIVFDPIDAVWDALNADEDRTPAQRVGRIAGEVVSNIPGGAQVAQLAIGTPEGRESFFGEADPTRFGTGFGVLGVRDLSPGELTTKALGAVGVRGVKQAETTIEGITAVVKGEATSRTGRTQFPVSEIVKPVLFGKYSTKTAQQYFDLGLQPLSDKQSEAFRKYVDQGADPNKVFYVFHRQRIETSVDKKRKELETSQDMTNEQKVQEYQKIVAEAQTKLNKIGNALNLSDSARKALREIEIDIPKEKKKQPTLQLTSLTAP